jgi:hypothetical protein
MESEKINFIFLLLVLLQCVAKDIPKRPLTEDEVLAFLLLESNLSDRFAVPVKFDEKDRKPKYASTRPVINVYDSLLSFENFSIGERSFVKIGLNKEEITKLMSMTNKEIPKQIASSQSVNVLDSLPDYGPSMGRYVVISRICVLNPNQAVVAIDFACEGCGFLELLLIRRANKNRIVVQDRLIVNLE